MPQAYSQYDVQGFFLAKQSALGTPGTALKTALGPTKITSTTNKDKVEGEPMLGQGFYVQKAMPTSYKNQMSFESRMTLDTFPALLLTPMCGAPNTDATGSPVYAHTFNFLNYNAVIPYFTRGEIYGATGASVGAGLVSEISRDNRINALDIKIDAKDAVRVTGGFQAINLGHGTGSETFALDSAYNQPVPDNVGTVITYDTWFPSNLCAQSIDLSWKPTIVDAGPCLGSGEFRDWLITNAKFDITLQFIWDSNAEQVYNYINFLTNTSGSLNNSSSIVSGFKEGPLTIKLVSTNNIGVSSTPYSIQFNFPNLQWMSAVRNSGQSPIMLEVTASTFGNPGSVVVTNGSTAVQMGL